MAKLTLAYTGKFTVQKSVSIPDELHDDYVSAQIEKLNLHHHGKPRPSDEIAMVAHLDAMVHDIEMVFNAHVNRKAVNAYIATLPTKRLTNG